MSRKEAADSAMQGNAALVPVIRALKRVRSAARVQLVTQRMLMIAAAIFVGLLSLGLLDYALRLPVQIRLLHLAAGVCAITLWVRRSVLPAARFRPTLTDVALRLERSPAARDAKLRGFLASGLELSDHPPGGEIAASLSAAVSQEAAERYAAFARRAKIFEPSGLVKAMAGVAVSVAPIVALWMLTPLHARIGLERTLTPWAAVSWPKRTQVADAGADMAHAAGVALPLRALLVRSDREPDKTDVTLVYRLVVDGRAEEERRVLMTPQHKSATAATPEGQVSGDVFERLLDPDALNSTSAKAGSQVAIEYSFKTRDDETTARRVLIVPPPAVMSASATVTAPGYAAALLGAGSTAPGEWFAGTRDVGPASAARGVIGPVLAGSRVELALSFNKRLPRLAQAPDKAALAEWVGEFVPALRDATDLAAGVDADGGVHVVFTAEKPVRAVVSLKDEFGISNAEDYSLRFEVLTDRAPTAAVIDPAQDESVLATAEVSVAGEGRDDVAVRSVQLEREIARPPAGSVGAPPESLGPPEVMATATPSSPGVTERGQVVANTPGAVRAGAVLDLGGLSLTAGDEVWLTAQVTDVFESQGIPRAPVVSAKRRLRIIAEGEFIEQVRAELSSLREAAKRTEQEQSRLASRGGEATQQPQAATDMAPHQQAITERLHPMQEIVKRLAARVDRNRLNEASLAGLLKDVSELAESAAKASEKASDALDRLAQQPKDRAENAGIKQAGQELAQTQKQVGDDLSELANMLDRGQDDWAVRRGIEKMLTEQQQLRAQTGAAGRETQGQERSKLNDRQREELSRLAKQQKELSQKADALLNSVKQRAEQMDKADPAQAQAMRSVSQTAQKQQLSRTQQKASEQIEDNKTGQAEQSQQEAEKALSSMLEELDKSQQHRDEALRRVLADVMQSIRKLIETQEGEIARLADAVAGKSDGSTLDAGMITLQRNTLSVQDTARAQMRGADSILSVLGAAAEAQGAAVVALRQKPQDQTEADANERVSLRHLKSALDEAQRMDEQAEEREEDRKRGELKKEYKELLELQVSVTSDTAPLVGKELDRREKSTSRKLGEREETIRARMADLREKTSGFEEYKLFDYAHTRFESAASAAVKAMGEAKVTARTGRDTVTAVRILQGLVQALDENKKQKDDFKEEEQSGNSGGGGNQQPPLIPPIAELKLLRAMQAEAAERTKAAADAADAKEEIDAVAELQRSLADHAKELLEKLTKDHQNQPQPQERN